MSVRSPFILGCALAILMVATSACSKNVVQSPVTVSETMSSEGKMEGQAYETDRLRMKSEAGKIPEEWPSDIPLLKESDVKLSAADPYITGTGSMSLVLTTDLPRSKVAEYYSGALQSKEWKIMRTIDAGTTTILLMMKDSRVLSCTITEGSPTTVSIGVQERTK